MKSLSFYSALTAMLLLPGCHNIGTPEASPAVLSTHSMATKQELQQAIQQMIGGEPVKLADSVFTDSDRLYIERAIFRDQRGLPIMGRHNDAAILFLLRKKQNQCILKHELSGQEVVLKTTECSAITEK